MTASSVEGEFAFSPQLLSAVPSASFSMAPKVGGVGFRGFLNVVLESLLSLWGTMSSVVIGGKWLLRILF